MFYSILFPTKEQHKQPRQDREPDYFTDLNLNQIFTHILTVEKGFGQKEKIGFDLETFFNTPLRDPEIIKYRQDILRELEDENLRAMLVGFAQTIYSIDQSVIMVHDAISSLTKWRDNYLTRGQLLNCTEMYCQTVSSFSAALSGITLRSAGLRDFAEYLKTYIASDEFIAMGEHAKRLREKLSTVEYCMLIKYSTIRVRQYKGQANLVQDVLSTFSKFSQGEGRDYRLHIFEESQDIKMEATVLNMVATHYKDIFSDLDFFFEKYYNFEDKKVQRFSSEIQFYLSWLAFIAPLQKCGLSFCYPTLNETADHLYCRDGFDLALAYKNRDNRGATVPNDFEMNTPERVIVVTGPNQGGKTTFARAFGQMHHLAALGLSVPGREASLFLFDNILTHFEREEDLTMLSGKLQDDLTRLRNLFEKATSQSIIIVNEIFGSTTLSDALSLGTRMMDALSALNAPALVVTFLDELATHGPEAISMMSTVKEDDPAERTFKITRKPPDGLAYAMHLTRKHGLTYEQLSGRFKK
jgi:DNA mismatch repair protein MutS